MTLTSDALAQAIKQHINFPFLVLLTLEHSRLQNPIRIVRNRQNIVSRGNTYEAYPFRIKMPTDSETSSTASITVSNVSRRITTELQRIEDSPSVTIEVVLSSALNTPQLSFPEFTFTDVTWDAFNIQGNLSQVQYWDEIYPKLKVTPKGFPGLFA